MSPAREDRWSRRPDERPVVARGALPGGSWMLHADYEPTRSGGEGLGFYIQFRNNDGRATDGGGCFGFELANDDLPVQLCISRRGPGSSFCYVGQAIKGVRRIELTLTNGRVVDAELVDGELPIRLWVAFTDGTGVPTRMRALGEQGELHSDEIAEHWPTKGTTSWLKDDD